MIKKYEGKTNDAYDLLSKVKVRGAIQNLKEMKSEDEIQSFILSNFGTGLAIKDIENEKQLLKELLNINSNFYNIDPTEEELLELREEIEDNFVASFCSLSEKNVKQYIVITNECVFAIDNI